MTELEAVILRRAEEQVASVRGQGRAWERDSWDVLSDRTPPQPPKRTRCLDGDCDQPVRVGSYCAMHAERIRATGVVDGPFGISAWRKRKGS